MSEQAPAGWYPDGYGNERFWDGLVWTEQLRQPADADPPSSVEPSSKKAGSFSRLKNLATDKQAEKRSAKEEVARKHAEDAQAAGVLVTSGVFGTSTVEIYAGGYVRVAAGSSAAQKVSAITSMTPFEKLHSIKFTAPARDKPSGAASAFEGSVGPTVARLVKGGSGLMKASVPGLAVAGVAHLASAEGRRAYLTIATDRQIHTLSNESHNGLMTKTNKGHNEVGLALEHAGNSLLGVFEMAEQQVAPEPQQPSRVQPVESAIVAAEPTLAERLRELAVLHADGILSDEEFTAAKARLLSSL